jgi:hypothetical protein
MNSRLYHLIAVENLDKNIMQPKDEELINIAKARGGYCLGLSNSMEGYSQQHKAGIMVSYLC